MHLSSSTPKWGHGGANAASADTRIMLERTKLMGGSCTLVGERGGKGSCRGAACLLGRGHGAGPHGVEEGGGMGHARGPGGKEMEIEPDLVFLFMNCIFFFPSIYLEPF